MRSPESTPSDPDELIRFGRIASVDLVAARCTVTLDEDGASGEAVTGPIRWLHGRAGGIKAWSPPSVGEEVILLCPGGAIGNAVAMGGLSNNDAPPAGATTTAIITFADGAALSYDPAAHALTFTLPGGGTVAITAPGGVTIEGDVSITGTLTASEDVLGGGKSLKTHTHGGVSAGSSLTGAPS